MVVAMDSRGIFDSIVAAIEAVRNDWLKIEKRERSKKLMVPAKN